jgi:uncharacterized membrane protein
MFQFYPPPAYNRLRMDPLTLLGVVVPLATGAIAVPLVFDLIPPNGLYGFRTPKTMSSPEIWYAANRASGLYLIAAAAIALVVNKLLRDHSPDLSREDLVFRMGMVVTVSLLAAVLASFLKLRRL